MATQEYTRIFQQGVSGYTGTADTMLRQSSPTSSYGNSVTISADGDSPGGTGQDDQMLLLFSGLIGSNVGQIPIDAHILSASLTLETSNGTLDGARLHRMLRSWSEADTWSSLGQGVQTDGVEAAVAADLVIGQIAKGTGTFDVTTSIQAWANGATNDGWLLQPQGGDGWDITSSEGLLVPKLTVRFTSGEPPANTNPVAQNDSAQVAKGGFVRISVLANDSDPDGDALTLSGIGSAPTHGTTLVNQDGTVTYTPAAGFTSRDSFTYLISDGHGGSASAIVNVSVETPGWEGTVGAIATTITSGHARVMEHSNSSKSFYHDGTWWSILPDGENWSVHRFDGLMPEPGALGGWTKASGNFKNNYYNADIAWDDVHDKLYVLNYGKDMNNPQLYRLSYDAAQHTWQTEASIQIAGAGGKLSGAHWSKTSYLSLTLDQDGNPLLSTIGGYTGTPGLRVAYATSDDLSTWNEVMLDPDVTSKDENSRADFVTFTAGGSTAIGVVYSSDSITSSNLDAWKIAYHTTSGYAGGWTHEIVNTSVKVDDHISVVSEDGKIYFAGKDDMNVSWLFSGTPGSWAAPMKIVKGPSRPNLVLDSDRDELYVFYQEVTGATGDIFMKKTSTANLFFDSSLGVRILESDSQSEFMYDPQTPTHSVGEHTGNEFFVFAKNVNTKEIWYTHLGLGSDLLA